MVQAKKRIVIKVGTAIFKRDPDPESRLGSLADDVCWALSQGMEPLIVSSGAIGAGIEKLNWKSRPQEISKKQAAAAVGQVSLMRTYEKLFVARDTKVAQVLLTRSDFDDRRRYLNLRTALSTLLKLGVVPIINENDTVAVEEIRFGDNDKLSALVSVKMDAEILILLTDMDGLCRTKAGARIPLVSEITPEIEKLAWKEGDAASMGTGGMASKIEAAKIATAGGAVTYFANGFKRGIVRDILEGKDVGTKFVSVKSLTAHEKWMLFGAVPKGEIVIDAGAAHALKNMRKSLLPAGALALKGPFRKGDVIKIKTRNGLEFARGMSFYNSDVLEKILGRNSGEIRKILNSDSSPAEIVHRDNLVLIP